MVQEEALKDDDVDNVDDHAIWQEPIAVAKIVITFAVQGVGAVAGSLFVIFLIYFSKSSRIDCDVSGRSSPGINPDILSVICAASIS